MDEPTSGLDSVSREDLLEVFLTLAGEGITILFSTHITSDLEKCADELLYLRGGKIVGRGGLDAFREQYRLVRLTAQQAAAAPPGRFIGVRPDRAGCTALIRAETAGEVGLPSEPAGLEAVMVHLEKEEER